MNRKSLRVLTVVLVVSLMITATALAATIDPINRTVSTGNFFIDWSETNPEEIVEIRWMDSPNLTNSGPPFCDGNLEYFGNSWVSEDEGEPSFFFGSLVGWGTTGTWNTPNSKKVNVNSISSGCFGSAGVSVTTNYQFYDSGPTANRIRVQRSFDFGATPYAHDIRPYIPRLYPRDSYTQVLHPNSTGASLVTDTTVGCDFGCINTDWDGSWFAIHDPATGQGMIVKRASTSPAALWIDQDDSSFTNSSSVLLLQPIGGFTGTVNETAFLCFYNSSIWSPSLSLPAGC